MEKNNAVPIDEERVNGTTMTWRIMGPDASQELRRRIFLELGDGVGAVRAIFGREHEVTVYPLSSAGMAAARRAAGSDPRMTVPGYQAWIQEMPGEWRRWILHYYGGQTQRRQSRTIGSAQDAIRRIRRRKPKAGIRIVTRTTDGEREARAASAGHNVLHCRQAPAWP